MNPSLFRSILIAGGAGFVGSNLAVYLKQSSDRLRVIAFDNLKRRGSEFNLERLSRSGVEFMHGDIRCRDDFESLPAFDLLVDCSAEPSVLEGVGGSPDYLLQTNLVGTINLLELARRNDAAFVFLSTSRVYPLDVLNGLPYQETNTRFSWNPTLEFQGITERGVSEDFTLKGPRSLYGASKLAGELILQEYVYNYGMPAIINRCSVLTGPWQMGKVDQGVITLWVARHVMGKPLRYIGYGGLGKQVRDILHIRDLFELLHQQMGNPSAWNGTPYNVGGGPEVSVSLLELTTHCQHITGNTIEIGSQPETSSVDIPIFLTDNSRVSHDFGWKPQITAEEIVEDIHGWIIEHREMLEKVF